MFGLFPDLDLHLFKQRVPGIYILNLASPLNLLTRLAVGTAGPKQWLMIVATGVIIVILG